MFKLWYIDTFLYLTWRRRRSWRRSWRRSLEGGGGGAGGGGGVWGGGVSWSWSRRRIRKQFPFTFLCNIFVICIFLMEIMDWSLKFVHFCSPFNNVLSSKCLLFLSISRSSPSPLIKKTQVLYIIYKFYPLQFTKMNFVCQDLFQNGLISHMY